MNPFQLKNGSSEYRTAQPTIHTAVRKIASRRGPLIAFIRGRRYKSSSRALNRESTTHRTIPQDGGQTTGMGMFELFIKPTSEPATTNPPKIRKPDEGGREVARFREIRAHYVTDVNGAVIVTSNGFRSSASFSGRQSYPEKSQTCLAWVASAEGQLGPPPHRLTGGC